MLRKSLAVCAALAALFLVAPQPAAAQPQTQHQPRVALVIGNAAYPKGPLQTSLADGGLVAEALQSIGFEIVEGADVNPADLRRLFRDFLDKVQSAGPDAIAFIYYSGYGIQFEGDNYLIPVDAQLERDSDIPIDGVRLFDLLRPLADVEAAAKIIVLDATRPLPFRLQGGGIARGLGAIEAAPGMLVAFSSAPGTVAPDGPGPYGAYATAIAEMVREPGLDIDTLFARIRLRTSEATNGMQIPWEVSQLQQVVMLVPGTPNAPVGPAQGIIAAPQAAIGAPVRRERRVIRDIDPEEAYAIAIEQDDLPTYVEYVQLYPNSAYAPRIWAMIRTRREALAWRRVLIVNTPEAYWTYLQRYPDGMYAFDARRKLRRLAAADRPPSGFRMMMFDDVPPPLAGEPARLFDVYPAAPAPRRFLAPPPAFIVSLPPPPRPGGRGLWRRTEPAFPVIVAPPVRPGVGGPPGPRGPAVVVQPPAGAPPPGFKGPPPQWQKPGTGIGAVPPGPPPGPAPQIQKGPAIVNQPPAGAPPPGFKGPPPQWQKPGTGIGAVPPGPPPGPAPQIQKGPAIVNQPPAGAPPPGFKGPPPQWQKPGTGIGAVPPGPPPGPAPQIQKGPAIVNQPPPGGPPPGFRGPPPNWQKPGVGAAPAAPPPQQLQKAPPPPPGPPPQMRAAPPPPPQPPRPPVVAAPPPPRPPGPPPGFQGPPPNMQKGPPPQAQKGPPLPKCALVQNRPPCLP